MSPDAVRTDNTHNASPKRPRDAGKGVAADLMRRLRASPSWQMLLALAFVLVALVGLCRVSGLSNRLKPLPSPTPTSTTLPTRTLLPTWTATHTAVPTPTATPEPQVKPGAVVVVTGTGAQQLRLRAGPGLTHETLRTLEDGTRLQVLEGPELSDGHRWWKVRTANDQEGWAAGDWLVPVVP